MRYTVLVTNTGDEPIDGVLIVDYVPAEMTVLSVPLVDAAEAVQIGSSRGHEDIVWNIGTVAPGETIALPWTARAVHVGDMDAANVAEAQVDGDPVASGTARTFLGDSRRGSTSNPRFRPIVKTVVKKVRVPAGPAVAGASETAAAPATLPVTGAGITPFVSGGLALVALGLALLWGSRRRWRAQAVAVVALLVLAACTSGDDRSATPQPNVSPSVLGERIGPGGEDLDEDDDAEGQPDDTGDQDDGEGADARPDDEPEGDEDVVVAPPIAEAPDVPTTTIRRVTVVRRVTLSDLPMVLLGSDPGDNEVGYEWDEVARRIPTATSGRTFTRDDVADVTTVVRARGDVIEVEVTVRNTAARERLRVKGTLVHEVSGAGGSIAHLESEPIDVVLDPGGETSAHFSYLLPSGVYTATGAFEPE